MLQKYQRQRNIKSFCCPITSQERVGMAASAANLSTVRLSSGISANILDFRLPQKHVLGIMPGRIPAAKRVVVKARRNQQRHGAGARASVNPGESPWEFRSSRPG